MNKLIFWFFGITAVTTLLSCEKTIDEGESDELLRLQAYMSIHYPDLNPTSSGLYYIINEQGTGDVAENDNFILYNYSVMGLNGNVVETNIRSLAYLYGIYSSTTRYAPNYGPYNDQIIKGLVEGISYLKPPAKARFIMPSKLAYGSSMYKGLNPYSSIIYDIELIKVVPDPVVYEQEQIDEFLANYFPFGIEDTILYDGVYYLELDEGKGEYFLENETVELDYVGSYLDGKVFDTSIKSVAIENGIYLSSKTYLPMEMIVGSNDVIEGYSLVMKKLRREGSAKVIITSPKAYSVIGNNTIRPYEPLVFDIYVQTKLDVVPDDDEEEEE